MIQINKRKKEPVELADFRRQIKKKNGNVIGKDYLAFRDLPEFKILQQALLQEQKYICCYCMSPIDQDSMVVEHFKCREKHGELSLTYSNLLASCKGCTNNSEHCDKNKGSSELSKLPNPSDTKSKISQIITFSTSGEIIIREGICNSENEKTDFLIEINRILNLNNEDLKKARTDVAYNFIRKFTDTQKMPRSDVKYLPFWGFTEFLLQKKKMI